MTDVVDDVLSLLRDCQLDDPAVRDFLETVIDAYPKAEDDSGPPFEKFRLLMLWARDERDTFRAAVDPFLVYAESNGGIDVARRLAFEDVDTLMRWYGDVGETGDLDAVDEAEWARFLAEYGEQAGWTGEEETWPEFKDYLLYYAEEAGFVEATTRLLEEAENAPDRVAFLVSYGVPVAVPEADEDAYDPDEWNAFLAEYTERSGWTGDEEAWPAYREFLLYYADERGFTGPTTSFLDAAEDASDRAAFFEQYGISLGYPEEELDAWYPFLAEHAVEWDGQDATWPRFRRSFLEAADAAGLTAVAIGFLDYAEGEPDRVAFFAQYGVTIGATAEDEPAETDTDAWNAFLAEYGPGWNGDEENWAAFRDWFLFYADERGVGPVAIAFLDYAEGEPDKVAFFAQYGIDVGPADAAGAADTASDAGDASEEAVAVAQQAADAVVTTSPLVGEEHQQLVSAAFAELLVEVPAAAGLSQAQIQQLIEEVAAEHL